MCEAHAGRMCAQGAGPGVHMCGAQQRHTCRAVCSPYRAWCCASDPASCACRSLSLACSSSLRSSAAARLCRADAASCSMLLLRCEHHAGEHSVKPVRYPSLPGDAALQHIWGHSTISARHPAASHHGSNGQMWGVAETARQAKHWREAHAVLLLQPLSLNGMSRRHWLHCHTHSAQGYGTGSSTWHSGKAHLLLCLQLLLQLGCPGLADSLGLLTGSSPVAGSLSVLCCGAALLSL